MQTLLSFSETPLRLWTVEEYHRMAEVGILQPDEPVELIAGQIIRKMSPQGSPHAASIRRTRRLLENILGKQVFVQTQLPIILNNYSEPEPDIAVVKPNERDYVDHHPTSAEIYLIIEIADTTLKIDRRVKAKNYAVAGIKDYWVLDVKKRQLYVFREPTQEGYQKEVILSANESIDVLEFTGVNLTIRDMLPPIIIEG